MLSVGGRITIHESRITRMTFGAHVSIRGALHLAVDRAVAIGCECLQIFVGSPRQWRGETYPETGITLFVGKRRTARPRPPAAPTASIMNLAAPAMGLFRPSTHPPVYSRRAVDTLD